MLALPQHGRCGVFMWFFHVADVSSQQKGRNRIWKRTLNNFSYSSRVKIDADLKSELLLCSFICDLYNNLIVVWGDLFSKLWLLLILWSKILLNTSHSMNLLHVVFFLCQWEVYGREQNSRSSPEQHFTISIKSWWFFRCHPVQMWQRRIIPKGVGWCQRGAAAS